MKKNIEKMVNTKVATEGDFTMLVKTKIDGSFFFIPEERALFEMMQNHFSEHGDVPSKQLIKSFFPSYEFSGGRDSWKVLLDELLSNKFSDEFAKLNGKLMDADRDAPIEERIAILQQGTSLMSEFKFNRGGIINLKNEKDNVIAGMSKAADWGLEVPWPSIYETTMGLVDGELNIIYGRPGSQKTFIMCVQAAHLFKLGYSWVFISREMPARVIQRRIVCILAGVNYSRYLRRRLTADEDMRFRKAAYSLKDHENCYIYGREEAGDGIGGMRAILQSLRFVDAIFNDGLYLMLDTVTGKPAIDWQAMGNVVWGIKKLLIEQNIPGVCTSQENRESEKKKSPENSVVGMSFSDLVGMTADIGMRLKLNKALKHIEVLFTKLRENSAERTYLINAVPCEDYSEKIINDYSKYCSS